MSALDVIRAEAPEPVSVALILGSGLGALASEVDGPAVPYDRLPGFPHAGVSGHVPALTVGRLGGTRVAILGGRAHYYEAGDATAMRVPLETVQALGAERLIVTNAAGAIRTDMGPGTVMAITDHINFSGRNPLIGTPGDSRFVNMADAYDPALRAEIAAAAVAEGIETAEGVYAWYSGPSFETPAEIRALGILGADAVGMSTVPEVILARHLGLRVAGLSAITNMAAGLSDERLSHAHTKANAPLAAEKIARILRRLL